MASGNSLSGGVHEIKVASVFIQDFRNDWVFPELVNVFGDFGWKIEILVGFIKLEV
jgi:hypothetical protein